MPALLASGAIAVAAAPLATAESLNAALSLTPHLLNVEMTGDERAEHREARLDSGLGLKLNHDLLQFSVDYRVKSAFKGEGEVDGSAISQQLGASLVSAALNEFLGLSASINAGSTINVGGDAYHYRIAPAFSKSLAELGSLNFQYEYLLDKASAQALEKQKSGYSMGLQGSARDGRVTWKGNYRATEVFGGVEQLQSTELLEFQSGLQLAPELKLEVSGRSMDETLFAGGLENDFYNETRYGAGLAWSPSRYYSVAFRVNKLEETRHDQDEVFGSGTVSWFPQKNLELTLSYGDHLVEGARGLVLSTKIDFNES